MTLPSCVLAYRILNSANLAIEDKNMCRATLVELKYEVDVLEFVVVVELDVFVE